ncbi:helix-turn-helix domain-containing protein [Sphingomonas aquatica]|uniref:helix-turn-helix domain-containing protein n=1 Tax=Sphingomonas aquatica TaxID=1763824 RepID=UPI001454C1EC
MQIIDLLLRGMAVGAQLGLGLALVRSADQRSLRIATLLFVISNICFTLNGFHPIRPLLGPFQRVLWLVQIGGAGYFWLFALALFEDRKLSATGIAPPALLTMIGVIGQYGPRLVAPYIWGLHNLFGLLLALHALIVIVRSGQTDLVEARRRLRVPFLLLIALFSILLSAVQIGQNFGVDAPWYELVNACIQAMLGIAGVAVLLEARPVLFGVARDTKEPDAPPPSTETAHWLARLDHAMTTEMLWQREGLTIGDLATAIGLPEHRLRRLINDELGHRNFASFVNQHRIAAARQILGDPATAARNIASIAFDLGFGSLGPFNRAFREATGVTPTEYRRLALAHSLPNSENPR